MPNLPHANILLLLSITLSLEQTWLVFVKRKRKMSYRRNRILQGESPRFFLVDRIVVVKQNDCGRLVAIVERNGFQLLPTPVVCSGEQR
jgi:hypothetical protein